MTACLFLSVRNLSFTSLIYRSLPVFRVFRVTLPSGKIFYDSFIIVVFGNKSIFLSIFIRYRLIIFIYPDKLYTVDLDDATADEFTFAEAIIKKESVAGE